MKKIFMFITVIAITMMLLAGCAVPGTSTTSSQDLPSGTGLLQVYVTDPPPPDMEKIMVEVESLQVHKTGGSWITIDENPGSFNLKELEGIQEYLTGKIIDAGKYTQIRLDVVSVIITAGGVEHTARVPSGEIKLVGNFEVADGSTTAITLDFNGKESVNVTGNDQYIFKPVVKLLVTEPSQTQAAAPTLVSIAVTPASPDNLAVGNTQQFIATGTYSDASTSDITSQVTWASSEVGVATIDAAGLATGVAVGSTGITASLDAVTSPAVALTVVAP
jgi:hypothetical protein